MNKSIDISEQVLDKYKSNWDKGKMLAINEKHMKWNAYPRQTACLENKEEDFIGRNMLNTHIHIYS